jgi:hypothetical protein
MQLSERQLETGYGTNTDEIRLMTRQRHAIFANDVTTSDCDGGADIRLELGNFNGANHQRT